MFYGLRAGRPFGPCVVEGYLHFCSKKEQGVIFTPYERAQQWVRHAFKKTQRKAPAILLLGHYDQLLDTLPQNIKQPATLGQRRRLLVRVIQELKLGTHDMGTFSKAYDTAVNVADVLDELWTAHAGKAPCVDHIAWTHPLGAMIGAIIPLWETLLAQQGWMMPQTYTRVCLEALEAQWKIHPPKQLLMVAGSTGSHPLTRQFMRLIHHYAAGIILFPGFWREEREQGRETSFSSARLIQEVVKDLGINFDEIEEWPHGPVSSAASQERQHWWQEAQRSRGALHKVSIPPAAFENLSLHFYPSTHQEAHILAREAYRAWSERQTPVVVVTGSVALGHKVTHLLQAQGLTVHHCVGPALIHDSLGRLWVSILRALQVDCSITTFLGLLKHQNVTLGWPSKLFQYGLERLEHSWLRGRHVPAGWEAIEKYLRLLCQQVPWVQRGLDRLVNALSPLMVLKKGHVPFSWAEWAQAHHKVFELLCPDVVLTDTSLKLWLDSHDLQGDEGWPALSWGAYVFLVERELSGFFLKDRQDTELTDVMVLGPREARLVEAQTILLGGLKEDVWPSLSQDVGGITAQERSILGLPDLDISLALSAHDFAQAWAQKQVVLTLPEEGSAAVSRFVERLAFVFGVSCSEWPCQVTVETGIAPREIALPVKPCAYPPLPLRPKKISVTQVELLRRDPYSFYAKHILKLHPLDPVNPPLEPAHWGVFIHEVFDYILKQDISHQEEDRLHHAYAYGLSRLHHYEVEGPLESFWKPRLWTLLQWFIAYDKDQRQEKNLVQVMSEVKASWTYTLSCGTPITLFAYIDRVEVDQEGCVHLVDYKTGTLPSITDIELGFSPQLPLEADIVKRGGIPTLGPRIVKSLSFWHLPRLWTNEGPIEVRLKHDPQDLATSAARGFSRWMEAFTDIQQGYPWRPWPTERLAFDDYKPFVR